MRSVIPSLALLSLLPLSLAAPAPTARQLLGALLTGRVSSLLKGINSAIAVRNPTAVNSLLVQITPSARPTAISQCSALQSSIWANPTGRTDFPNAVAIQVAVGLGPPLAGTLNTALTGALPVGENSITNNNPAPSTKIFPKKDSADAPYSLTESALRQALFIPSSFTYGKKPPTIFVPGTGSYGGINFGNNLRRLLTGASYADPVWLNIPGGMLADAQTNAEYIAYAINYISAVSKNSKKISVITWSQGGLDTQWALKYWPSTRKVVTDFLPVSADFKGTVFANALCLSTSSPCPPSVIQQQATSRYVASLRSNGGDSAYVPTTSFYSSFFDEVVEPQSGTGASAYMNDARKVGVTNVEVQSVCSGAPAGTFYEHAGVLFNPLTYALIVDALTHDGPGSLSRINKASVCSTYAAPGLVVDDVISTSGLIPIALVLLLAYPDKRTAEPALRSYAA
ncbi:alpha/beta-hydrolase [Dothidotthia symphoricarpi CBS 119687]|uniref:Alpha/beta-hydrolase n=1 Tax=Dothidotthia symphoricarpi CBS 119687 TaxID=1392245 RepID=A0A6A5ZYA3_9PLEO|nr:alpha/beta-hydrolase [Dothidotthia symphoricarpi CBS 119687]KAF2124519.1 alpha/beta-hydrolase [Dothidotthia symphoricarpi CBS 119687]